MVISSQQNKTKHRLFTRTKRRSIGFLLMLMFTLALMFTDFHYKYLNTIRTGFSFIVEPLQYAVDYPVRIINWVSLLVSAKANLIQENIELRYHQTMLEADLQRLISIKEENSQLKELLLASSSASMRAMAGQILAVDTTLSRHLIILNKGRRDKVYIGQPVLDAKGVMGQIIDVGYMTSTALLISDAKSAVPVRNNRTGEQAILIGQNNLNQLSLINLPKTSKIAKNDILVTSGLGRLYPEGYPIGQVTAVTSIPGEAFISVSVSPIAMLSKNRLVLLIWPDKEQKKLTAQINERMDSAEKIA